MKYLRYLLILMGLWLFLVGNLEGWLGAPTLTPYAYLIIAACAIVPIFTPSIDRGSPFVLFSVAILLLIALRAWGGHGIDQANLQVIAVELVAIGVTILLATLVAAQINAFQSLFENLGLNRLPKNIDTFDEGQHAIYREVRWARRYQRHLALLAIALNENSLNRLTEHQNAPLLTHRLAREAQSEIWRTYALSQLAQLLVEELEDNAVVTQRRDHFVVVLTEVDREQAYPIVERLKTLTETRLGIKLDIGIAVFPDEAVTFEALLQQAETTMAETLPLPATHSAAAEAPKAAAVVSNRQEIRAADEIVSSV